MFSSIIWLILLQLGILDAEYAPWIIYIPACLVEVVVYILLLPKFCDWIDEE